jgi:hypothetical protein
MVKVDKPMEQKGVKHQSVQNEAQINNRYANMIVCSNNLLDYTNFIVLGGVVPVQITKGDVPKIWLKAVQQKEGSEREFIDIVKNSISKHPSVKVYQEDKKIIVSVQNIKVLSVFEKDSTTVVIDYVDLSPLGLNIKGSAGGLEMGGAFLSGNTVSGSGALIGSP